MARKQLHVALISCTPDPEKTIARAAKTCYSASTVDELSEKIDQADQTRFIQMLLRVGHLSTIEHVSFTFAVEGVSRALLAQITRHRIASFSVQSQRYVSQVHEPGQVFDYILPPAIEALGPQAAAEFVKSASSLWYDRIGSKIAADAAPESVMKSGILASLVEGEAKAADERPILAGIFLKRLEKNMRLQSCATVIYAWDELNIRKSRLSYRDLEINSPYNTYLVGGLPPGPICAPSESSWKSALEPEESDYLFFFADREGRHVFSKSYEEHLAKQRRLGL